MIVETPIDYTALVIIGILILYLVRCFVTLDPLHNSRQTTVKRSLTSRIIKLVIIFVVAFQTIRNRKGICKRLGRITGLVTKEVDKALDKLEGKKK